MSVEINDRFRPRTDRAFLSEVVARTLEFAGRGDLDVSMLLCDDAEMARLHGEFLGDPTTTDVMSFPLDDSVELVVNVECARREAQARGHAIRAEIALYIVHGLLHVCGYDDIEDDERARMREAEQQVMHALGLRIASVDG